MQNNDTKIVTKMKNLEDILTYVYKIFKKKYYIIEIYIKTVFNKMRKNHEIYIFRNYINNQF